MIFYLVIDVYIIDNAKWHVSWR